MRWAGRFTMDFYWPLEQTLVVYSASIDKVPKVMQNILWRSGVGIEPTLDGVTAQQRF